MAITQAMPDNTLFSALQSAPQDFLQPPKALHASTLSFLKSTLDPIAADLADAQQQRLQESRKKRKRGQHSDEEDVLRLKKVHVEGFAIEQVWEQARRVIDAARHDAEKRLDSLKQQYAAQSSDSDDQGAASDASESEDAGQLGEEGVDYVVEGEDAGEEEYHTSNDEDHTKEDLEDGVEDEDDQEEDDGEDIDQDSDMADDTTTNEPTEEYVPDPHGLNDGFFSIDDFNRQSEFLEQADARGDENVESDDEDVDWGSNPLGAGANAADDEEMQDDEDGEGGPTFGNADLNAPFSDDEDDDDAGLQEGEMDDMNGLSNTNNIKYEDFFAPPAKKASKKKKGRPNPHNFPAAEQIPGAAKDDQDIENDMNRTIEAVHRDLFDESDEEEEEDEEAEQLDPADPRSRRSTHERRRAEIEKEIRKLEAANVAKREWTLSGEARAADRPLNSLLEEDLDFERAGKPVPVITAEVSESIEELIKRRILAHDFQDIIRRRPDDLATGGKDARRGRLAFELDDSKSKKSLAEQYEEEHLKRTDPNHVDARDEQAAKQQREIEGLWRDIAHKLDSLSSFHFKPGPRAAQLDIRVDAPVVRLEDARPTAGVDAAGAGQLAPQEVYRAGEGVVRRSDEVATRGGMPVAREEMSREEKKRRRRRDKERERKGNANSAAEAQKKPESKKSRQRREVIGDLKKGNVKVIGKKGELTNVEGDAVRGGVAASAGAYKL